MGFATGARRASAAIAFCITASNGACRNDDEILSENHALTYMRINDAFGSCAENVSSAQSIGRQSLFQLK
ncbi:MAG: hypothetical protein F9K21_05420 [Rhodocyclaceae bacterium]|nr:MAG: hypothetical protein F9K21_05420 [Rhodocyclaceae bacterium]MBE7422616.1 hypothetical protein [Zoogloeaceae bacterium]